MVVAGLNCICFNMAPFSELDAIAYSDFTNELNKRTFRFISSNRSLGNGFFWFSRNCFKKAMASLPVSVGVGLMGLAMVVNFIQQM